MPQHIRTLPGLDQGLTQRHGRPQGGKNGYLLPPGNWD